MSNLDRRTLAQFLPNREAIAAFEKMFKAVGTTLPSTIEEANALAGSALTVAQAALSALAVLADSLARMETAPAVQPSNDQDDTTPRAHLGTISAQNADSVEITGGTCDNTPIGATTPSTGKFTNLIAKLDQTAATSVTVSNAGTPGATTIMQFELAETLGASRGWFRRYRDGTGLTELGFSADLNFLGGVGGTTASLMRLKSSGSLLIGTTTDGMTAGGSLAIAQDFGHRGTKAGFYNTSPVAKQTVTGSRAGNAALASLLTALAATGLITDSTTP